ncbi:pyridoxamine 5'-phosphate oxidase family protein [Flavobacterium soli]|uniref:pyridoxamine 5'-phosphate oxidase family protein n=1 Tax=Flavobacterium soli TaxID=344881 RepID=UPI00040353F2|nr:pyridoxamine 5'-phosphate oxidase family protein [Flavobacterium soli]
MSDLKNLTNEKAVAKLKKLAEASRICMFCTDLNHTPFSTRPMSVQEVDEMGNLWFLSSADSNKNFEIRQDESVQLLFSNVSDSEYLSVYGKAFIYKDKTTIEDKWSPLAKAWFTEGKDDPNLTVLRVQPEFVYYWDTKNGKMVSMLKIAAGAIIGKTMDDGVEGKLSV